jgi:hypothetical protein
MQGEGPHIVPGLTAAPARADPAPVRTSPTEAAMNLPFRGMIAAAVLFLLGACVGIVPIPVQTGTTTVPAGDATPPGPDGIEGDT